jgi:hypothetical protein
MGGVDGRVVHVQQARGPQLGQQHLVQLRPDQPRSSPADASRPSHRCSQPVQPEHPASSRSCTARKRCPAARPGHPSATARDTGAAETDEQATAGPHAPTGPQAQDQQTPNRSCRQNTQPPSFTTNFILNDQLVVPGFCSAQRADRPCRRTGAGTWSDMTRPADGTFAVLGRKEPCGSLMTPKVFP